MTTAPLHLVDRSGTPIDQETVDALRSSFRWALSQFPLIDPAMIATWAEEVGIAMSERTIHSPKRYATAALHGKIREYFRSGGFRETSVGASYDLEKWVGIGHDQTKAIERSILFDQIRVQLSDRDKLILVLLRQDITSPRDVGIALDLSYDAAAKAIQRVRDRLREILTVASDATQNTEAR